MIRPANSTDITRLQNLGSLLHSLSSYSSIPYSPEKVSALLSNLLTDPNAAVFVAEHNGVIVGGIAGQVVEHWFSEEKLAFDYSLFVEPTRRHGVIALRLLTAFFEWAKLRGAVRVRLGITTGINPEGTARLYRALGMTDCGLLFEKVL